MEMTNEQCEKVLDSVIEMNKNMVGLTQDMQWLKSNAENQTQWCKLNEARLVELEKWMGRSKGHFKVLGRALAVIAAAITAALAMFYQFFRGA